MKGPNFRSVKESNLKLGPKEQDQLQKLNRKESINKRPLNKKKTGGIDSFFAKSNVKSQIVKDEKELIRWKNKEILEKAKKEPENDVSISWESKSSYSLGENIIKGGLNSYKELEDLLRTLEVEGAGAGVRIWEGFFNSVRKLIKEVQELKNKVVELSKVVSQEEFKSEKEEKNLVNKEVEMDKRIKQREERIKAYKEEGTWLEEDQWKLLNDGQKSLKRFRFSDKHQNMDPFQFNQLTFEEKEMFMLSKLSWRTRRRRELMELLKDETKQLQAELSLKDLDFFNGRYFNFYKKKWEYIGVMSENYDLINNRRKSRYRNRTGNHYDF